MTNLIAPNSVLPFFNHTAIRALLTVVIAGTVITAPAMTPHATATPLRHSMPTITPLANAQDVTTVSRTRVSRSARKAVSFAEWQESPTGKRIARAESGGNCKAVSRTGKYRGKWQMDANFWASYGGLDYASKPDLATCEEQDKIAYRGWIARHWSPWTTY